TNDTDNNQVQDPIFNNRYQNIEINSDTHTLTKIDDMTEADYFRATDTKTLKDIYEQINNLEKTNIKEIVYTDYQDLYPRFLLPGILFVILSLLSDRILFRSAVE